MKIIFYLDCIILSFCRVKLEITQKALCIVLVYIELFCSNTFFQNFRKNARKVFSTVTRVMTVDHPPAGIWTPCFMISVPFFWFENDKCYRNMSVRFIVCFAHVTGHMMVRFILCFALLTQNWSVFIR